MYEAPQPLDRTSTIDTVSIHGANKCEAVAT